MEVGNSIFHDVVSDDDDWSQNQSFINSTKINRTTQEAERHNDLDSLPAAAESSGSYFMKISKPSPGTIKRHEPSQEILDTLKVMVTEAEAQDNQNALLATNVVKFFNIQDQRPHNDLDDGPAVDSKSSGSYVMKISKPIPGTLKRHKPPQEVLDTWRMMTEAEAQIRRDKLLATNVLKFFNVLAPLEGTGTVLIFFSKLLLQEDCSI